MESYTVGWPRHFQTLQKVRGHTKKKRQQTLQSTDSLPPPRSKMGFWLFQPLTKKWWGLLTGLWSRHPTFQRSWPSSTSNAIIRLATKWNRSFFLSFFAPSGLENRLSTLYDQCYTCQSMTKFRLPSTTAPLSSPDHPGTHMQADVMKRCNQLILVNTDLFSNYTTWTWTKQESAENVKDITMSYKDVWLTIAMRLESL